jgi:hypothetical protein
MTAATSEERAELERYAEAIRRRIPEEMVVMGGGGADWRRLPISWRILFCYLCKVKHVAGVREPRRGGAA